MNQQILHLWLIQLILNRLLLSCPTQDIVRFNLLLAQAPTECMSLQQITACIYASGIVAKTTHDEHVNLVKVTNFWIIYTSYES